MSRTRLLRPAFFSDERMARMAVWTRLIYIGLWTLADDAGYFERRPAEIGVALFPYEPAGRRLKRIEAALVELAEQDRIRWLDCGDHGTIPTLPEHGVITSGNHAYTYKAKHDSDCAATLFRSRAAKGRIEVLERVSMTSSGRGEDKVSSESVSESGLGSVSDSGRAAARDSESLATKAAAAAGGFIGAHAAKVGVR